MYVVHRNTCVRRDVDVECLARRRRLKHCSRRRLADAITAATRRDRRLPDDTHQPTYPTWAQRVREVPDMLVAAQLSLGALAKNESTANSAEARRIVRDACDLLRIA